MSPWCGRVDFSAFAQVPLDVLIAHRLGVPAHPELAAGAIACGGVVMINDDVICAHHISADCLEPIAEAEGRELRRRERVYRGDRPMRTVVGHIVIIVDDGLATGATLNAAIEALGPKRLAMAVLQHPICRAVNCDDDSMRSFVPQRLHHSSRWARPTAVVEVTDSIDGDMEPDEQFYPEQNAGSWWRPKSTTAPYSAPGYRPGICGINTCSRRYGRCPSIWTVAPSVLRRSSSGRTIRISVMRAPRSGADIGERNVGQLARQNYPGQTCSIGFTTHSGTVTAADHWGGAARRMQGNPALDGSAEHSFHRIGFRQFLLLTKYSPASSPLRSALLERAIGVIYRPQTERQSHVLIAQPAICRMSPTAVAAKANTKMAIATAATICVGVYRRRALC